MAENGTFREIKDEESLKGALVSALQSRAKLYDSQHKCAHAWGIRQPTVNYIVNAKMERLTIKQLLGIAWKSGADITIGLNYQS